MNITTEKLKELLVGPGHITEEQFVVVQKQAEQKKKSIESIIVDQGLIKDEQLGQLIAEHLEVPFVNLKKEKIDEKVLHMIPEVMAKSAGVIAFKQTDKGVKVGMTNPDNSEVLHMLQKRFGQSVLPYYITEPDFHNALTDYSKGMTDVFADMLERLKDSSLTREDRDDATVEMVDQLLQYGYQNRVSDIHVEPGEKNILVRFRIDGVLHDVLDLPKEVFELMLTRIKILSKMRTDEHRAAQDGKLRFTTKEERVDVRVSIVPTSHGENIVMRLLSFKSRTFGLSDLGLSGEDLKKVNKAIKHPHGMILVTGPTGSGKTTTLYGVMKILNKREVNIATIEDPVEYDVVGITQIQVNTKTNLTFAQGLRALVRQDPDIIMVGEIRDEETAGIAVNSAMTGHLVLSTLHTNDASTTLPRLLDMNIEPFLVASTINVAIAQRLVRKICVKCRVSYTLADKEVKAIENEIHLFEIFKTKTGGDLTTARLYKGAGCKVCGDTGYSGRVGVFEVLEMEDNIKQLILKRASSDDILAAARENGMTTMMEDGIRKVFAGETTLEEVLRVTRD